MSSHNTSNNYTDGQISHNWQKNGSTQTSTAKKRRNRNRRRSKSVSQEGQENQRSSSHYRPRTETISDGTSLTDTFVSVVINELLVHKIALKDALHEILSTHFTEFDVSLFIVGSSATGLANNEADVDICIVMNEIEKKSSPEEEKPKDTEISEPLVSLSDTKTEVEKTEDKDKEKDSKTQTTDETDLYNESCESLATNSSNGKNDPSIPMLEKIEEVLKNYNFVTKMQIILAKVPILKFNDRISGIEVTLNVNKLVSIRNTLLIHDYTKLDWRVQPLLLVIKAWAKDHNIKDAYNKSISSYSLVLMVIHYLQYACEPPVLPCLQKLDPNRYDPEANIRSIRFDSRPIRWKSYNDSSLKELLIGFLDYFSYTFCYSKDAISVRLGQTVAKHEVQRFKSDENSFYHWRYLSIEEPFNRTNTARSVYDQVTFEHILSVFRVSHYTLRRYPFLDSIMTGKQFTNEYCNRQTVHKPEPTTAPVSYETYLSGFPIRRRNTLSVSKE